MGDVRYQRPYDAVARAPDREDAIRSLSDEEVVQALGAASRSADPLLANVLATEALNRVRRLRAALANLGEGVVAMDIEGRIRWLNPAAERLLGWRREEALGADFHALAQHADAAGWPVPRERCPILRAARGETAIAHGEHFRTHSGNLLCVAYASAPLAGPGGEPEGIVLAFQDFTERNAAERRIRESEERYKSLFTQFPAPIVSISPDGRVLDANGRAETFVGIRLEEARGRPFQEFLHPDDVRRAQESFARVLGGEREENEFRIIDGEGRSRRVRTVALPVLVDSHVAGVHVVMQAAEAP